MNIYLMTSERDGEIPHLIAEARRIGKPLFPVRPLEEVYELVKNLPPRDQARIIKSQLEIRARAAQIRRCSF